MRDHEEMERGGVAVGRVATACQGFKAAKMEKGDSRVLLPRLVEPNKMSGWGGALLCVGGRVGEYLKQGCEEEDVKESNAVAPTGMALGRTSCLLD